MFIIVCILIIKTFNILNLASDLIIDRLLTLCESFPIQKPSPSKQKCCLVLLIVMGEDRFIYWTSLKRYLWGSTMLVHPMVAPEEIFGFYIWFNLNQKVYIKYNKGKSIKYITKILIYTLTRSVIKVDKHMINDCVRHQNAVCKDRREEKKTWSDTKQ